MTPAEIAAREKALYVREALVEYPGAAPLVHLISGTTEDEIRQQAADLHEHAGGPQQDTNPYGRPGVLGGGSVPGSSYVPPELAEERWTNDFAAQWNAAPRDAYGGITGISPRDVDRYASNRFFEHIRGALAQAATYRSDGSQAYYRRAR